jgi:hypothetical protein
MQLGLPPLRIAYRARRRYKKILAERLFAGGRMHTWKLPSSNSLAVLFACLIVVSAVLDRTLAAQPGPSISPMLQERFGLNEQQVRDALGALLVFTRERLPKPEFDELARTIPNADMIMQQVKLRGIVTRPLDDMDDYENALGNTGIPAAYAAEFAPAVLEVLHTTGYDRERDILARALN